MGKGGEGPVRIAFPFHMGWYNEQACTRFNSLEHRKEPKGFQHEFIVLKLTDGSVCRVERMGDPDKRVEALSDGGSVAYDIAEYYKTENISNARLGTSTVVAEIHFPCELDLKDVLNICRAIHEVGKTRNYTLRSYNCYFFALVLQCCLARMIAGWEKRAEYNTWISKMNKMTRTAWSNVYQAPSNPQKQLPLILRLYSVLCPSHEWSAEEFLEEVWLELCSNTNLRPEAFRRELKGALSNELWYSSLELTPARFVDEEIRQAVLNVVQGRLARCKVHNAIVNSLI